mmetsp:Transcript_64736/g.134161  ORF Transcript_64736/g.134161 Transcript_64736/m.134161 type:complete len:511 (+) Transcript_64736:39-1571(+)
MELQPLAVDETGQLFTQPLHARTSHDRTCSRPACRALYDFFVVVLVLVLAITCLTAAHPLHAFSLSRLVGLAAVGAAPVLIDPNSIKPPLVNTTKLLQQALLYGHASVATTASAKNHSWPPAALKHAGEDCWRACGNVSGDCAWCGIGNACCRQGATMDPPECEGVTFATTKSHTCVTPAKRFFLKHASQDCLLHCNGRSGYCDWCGSGNVCCMERAASVDAPECKGAYSFRISNEYRCVPTTGVCDVGVGELPDGKGGCKKPDTAPSTGFYMYKASSPFWPRELNLSTNMGSLGGVLWYLHNDIVTECPRKHGIDRIERFFVTTKPTDALYQNGKRLFDSFREFRQGKVQDPSFKASHWDKYGYNVGCVRVDPRQSIAFYPDAIWYSLPGRCPTQEIASKTERCELEQPGGYCDTPNGNRTCTWTATFAGEVLLDDLAGITDPVSFCNLGGFEYDIGLDKGIQNDFWNGKLNLEACSRRVDQVQIEFAKKYPYLPSALDRHPCSHEVLE